MSLDHLALRPVAYPLTMHEAEIYLAFGNHHYRGGGLAGYNYDEACMAVLAGRDILRYLASGLLTATGKFGECPDILPIMASFWDLITDDEVNWHESRARHFHDIRIDGRALTDLRKNSCLNEMRIMPDLAQSVASVAPPALKANAVSEAPAGPADTPPPSLTVKEQKARARVWAPKWLAAERAAGRPVTGGSFETAAALEGIRRLTAREFLPDDAKRKRGQRAADDARRSKLPK